MDLKSILVNDLPLSGRVSFSHDISSYVKSQIQSYVNSYVQNYVSSYVSNSLRNISYDASDIMSRPLSNVIINISYTLSRMLSSFGGNVVSGETPIDNPGGNDNPGENEEPGENTENIYIVIFYDYDMTTMLKDPQNVVEGHDAVPPANPVRDGYEFIGWSPSYMDVHSNLNICAQYRPIENEQHEDYIVSFFTETSTLISAVTAATGQTVTAPDAPSKVGHHFIGFLPDTWLTTPSDCSTYATYEPNQYVVTFDGNGGTPEFTSAYVTYGQQYGTLPSCSIETNDDDTVFAGWMTMVDAEESAIVLSTDIYSKAEDSTLSAMWRDYTTNILQSIFGEYQMQPEDIQDYVNNDDYSLLDNLDDAFEPEE